MSDDRVLRLNAALEGRYRIERELGEGGMATVYLAEDLRHERKVALKVLKPELAAVVGAVRFLAEIRTTAKLQHPHILALHDSGEADGLLFYVMPYSEGESLRARLDREHQLPVDDAVRIGTNLAEALDYAHRQGVIHRDIKPANVLLLDGKPVISDFGIALAVSAGGGGRLTETGLSLGTPHYMSPEQATGDPNVGPTSDIFSLGCVLYEMLVGEPPFTASTPQAVLGRILAGDSHPVRVRRTSVPVNVDAVVARALEKVPADRFASAAEFAAALVDPGFRHGGGEDRSSDRIAAAWRRRSLAASAAAASLAALVTWWAVGTDSEPAPVTRYLIDFPPGQERATSDLSLALSPNGDLLVYAGAGDRLWLRERDQLVGSPVEGTEQGVQPTFSPDGSQLAFVTAREQLVTVPTRGGPRRVLVEANVRRLGVAWAPDGYVYFTLDPSLTLHRVADDGSGEPEPLTALDVSGGDVQHGMPEALPSGRGVVFLITRSQGDGQVAVLDSRTGEKRTLTTGRRPRFAESGHLMFLRSDGSMYAARFDQSRLRLTSPASPVFAGLTPGSTDFDISADGRLVYHSGGTSQPVWVTRGGVESPVDSTWFGANTIDISPDGRRVVFSSGGDLWIKDLPDGRPKQFTFDGTNLRPAWTPDGGSVTFVSRRRGNEDLWIREADGRQPPRLLVADSRRLLQSVSSPDGTSFVVRLGAGSERDLYWTDAAAHRLEPLVATPSAERAPTFAPDGRWVAYVSDQTGQDEIYVIGFPPDGGSPTQVSREGGTQPLWSHDGDEIFYFSGRNELVAAQVQEQSDFFVGARDILFSTSPYPDDINGRSYDVTPDDQRFMMVRSGTASLSDRVTVVEGYFVELERLVRD